MKKKTLFEETTSRRNFLKTLGVGAASLSMPVLQSNCGARRSRPNILFIMSDDHACQAIGCYGSRINQTPNIDRLAADGVRFSQSFCTNSICAPSRAVLLTGKYSHLNGQIDNRLEFDGAQQTFPKLLQHAGYETAMFGKWHLKSDPTGFDFWDVLPGQGHYYNPDFNVMGQRIRREGYVTDLITDQCLNWLGARRSDKPFCALLHHKAPHRSWMPNLKHLDLYEDIEIPLPETLHDDYATRSEAARQQEMTIANHTFMAYDLKLSPLPGQRPKNEHEKSDHEYWFARYNRFTEEQRKAWDAAYGPRNEAFRQANLKGDALVEWKYQRYIKDYLRCIASVDENIGRVLDFLDEANLTDDTIVVYTSDQGFYLGEHGWFDKRFMYEESLRLPMIFRYPREIKPAGNEDAIVLNLDYAPTFLDYAGLPAPEDMQGRSLRGILRGRTPRDWRRSMYYHYYEYPAWHMVKRHYGVRTDRYKLIHFYHDINAWELYDLREDPHELRNVYGDPEYADIVVELKAELNRLREYYGDTADPMAIQ